MPREFWQIHEIIILSSCHLFRRRVVPELFVVAPVSAGNDSCYETRLKLKTDFVSDIQIATFMRKLSTEKPFNIIQKISRKGA